MGALGFAKTAVVIVAYCIVGNALTLVNKIVMMHFPYPNVVVLVQCIVTIGLVLCGEKLLPHITGDIRDLEWPLIKQWIWLTILFFIMLLSSMYALETVTVPTMIVVRNLATLVTAVFDVVFLKSKVTAGEVLTLLCILGGAIFYGFRDINFHATGYCWLVVNVLATSGYQVYVKRLVAVTKFNSSTMTYYNNTLCLPFLFMGAQIEDEFEHLGNYMMLSGYVQTMAWISTVLGFAMSITGFLLNHEISATSIMVVNNSNKFALIFINEFFLQRTQTFQSGLACAIVMVSAAGYSYIRMKGK
jgi:drug/metabolite transporter (DMT)-like permease